MAQERLLTTREVSLILGISDKEVIDLSSAGVLPHFKVAGEFLRFRGEDILKVKNNLKKKHILAQNRGGRTGRIRDFFYFNDFYIICTAVIIFFLWIIIKDLHP